MQYSLNSIHCAAYGAHIFVNGFFDADLPDNGIVTLPIIGRRGDDAPERIRLKVVQNSLRVAAMNAPRSAR